MKKILLLLLLNISLITFACDADPGCTCVVQEITKKFDIHCYTENNIEYFQFIKYDGVNYTGIRKFNDEIKNPWLDNDGKARLNKTISPKIKLGKKYIITQTNTLTYNELDCGSDECKKPNELNITYGDIVIKQLTKNGEITLQNATFTFSKIDGDWYVLKTITINNDETTNITITSDDVINNLKTSALTLPKTQGAYLTPQSPLIFSPYYKAKTTSATLYYKTKNMQEYAQVITINNLQNYSQNSYVFGRTPLKNITLNNVNLTVKAIFSNGINEYETNEITFDFKQNKGLK